MNVANDNEEAASLYEVREGTKVSGVRYWFVARRADKRREGAKERISIQLPSRDLAYRCIRALEANDRHRT